MKHTQITFLDLAATINLSSFVPKNGVAEHHAIIELQNKLSSAETQHQEIEEAVNRLHQSETFKNSALVFKRYFVSDAANQAAILENKSHKTAISIVQQPPLNGTKVSIWVYFVDQSQTYSDETGTIVLVRPTCTHLYTTQLQKPLQDEYSETESIFNTYQKSLSQHNCTLKDHCIRTWIFVQNVDLHYEKMVKARTAFFQKEGLTQDTHYIASTGIEGRHLNPKSLVLIDAYAIKGIIPPQINYLHAPTHLNPTHEYGVTFERGTTVDYGDRRHIYISGTASIDNTGEIVHPRNIQKQIERTLENIEVLLTEAESEMNDVAKMIIYLRDTADYDLVASYFNIHHSQTPKTIVWAPVCRPGWLIEIECIAIKEIERDDFESF